MSNDTKNATEISIQALINGNREEFAKLVDQYSVLIYRLALKMVDQEEDAEDILQETFLKAYRNISSFRGESNISTWLYRIAMNEALMSLRRRKGKNNTVEIDADDQKEDSESLQIVDWGNMPEKELLSVETRKFLDQAVSTLSPALRSVFLLRDVEGLSVKDTADVLELTEMAVKTRLSRARLILRQKLSTYFSERTQIGDRL
jgi:RNA polymerase sigma-70 factor, ECF subfamily